MLKNEYKHVALDPKVKIKNERHNTQRNQTRVPQKQDGD